ncbi:outer membrane protein assembly factor BamB family protein [Streptomyces purpureus]|uniref:Protein kinase domain-containing protein n=1 Tax=Streptomyces purpureus TaxID=1951 RepID=A0A918H2D0_9ACTN|nr:PQQ-binding-like beta-propeller repeat protein [Streptomyces purpureus]GGT33141.1 hypothetical protein GCM10014713_28350 [Streptomyces purpureus]
MEPLQQDDPRQVGPYVVRTRLRQTAAAVRYLGRDEAGAPVVVTVPRPELAALPAFRRRFRTETRTAERLAGGWVCPPLATGEGDELWTVDAYVPGVTLAEAISLAGPLPEKAVRILGAGLAETLSRVHATGAVLHGLTPETVELATDGPRLTAYGALGAAASAQAGPGRQLSVRLGYLTPEQIAGKEPGPASDLFVLGLLLTYAATGTTPLGDSAEIAHKDPELTAVPEALRPLVADCLSKDPSARPSAGSAAATLALEGAAALARDGWLPQPLLDALAAREAEVGRMVSGDDVVTAEAARAAASGDALAVGTDVTDSGAVGADAGPVGADVADHHRTGARAQAQTDQQTTGTDAADDPGTGAQAVPAPGSPAGEDPVTTRFGTGAQAPAAAAVAPAASGDALGVGAPAAASAPGPLAATEGMPPAATDGVAPVAALPPAAPVAASAPGPLAATEGMPPVAALPPAAPAAALAAGAPAAPVAALPPGPPTPDTATTQLAALPRAQAGDRVTTQLAVPGQRAPLPAAVVPPSVPPAAGPTPPSAPKRGQGLDRRALLIGAGGGLLIGAGGGLALSAGGDESPAPPAKPAAPKPRPPVAGVPPVAAWRYEHSAAAAAVVDRHRLLLTSAAGTTAVDLASGRRIWEQPGAASARRALPTADGPVFVAGASEFLWLSPSSGKIEHRAPHQGLTGVVGQDGPVVWCTAPAALFAYDVVRRKELWRTPAPGTYELVAIRPAQLVVRQNAATLTAAQAKAQKGRAVFYGYDRATGKLLWKRQFGAVALTAPVTGDAEGRVYAALPGAVFGYASGTGAQVWKRPAGPALAFGRPVRHGSALYVAQRSQSVFALDAAGGAVRWQRATEAPAGPATAASPEIVVGASGRTVLAADATQVTAFGAEDGRRLWKFQDAGAQAPGQPEPPAEPYRVLAAGGSVVVGRGRAYYSLPLD